MIDLHALFRRATVRRDDPVDEVLQPLPLDVELRASPPENIYCVYRVITPTGHTYVGYTKNQEQRSSGHWSDVRIGRLGRYNIPPSWNARFETMAENLTRDQALMLESELIALDKQTNPEGNCNTLP